MIIKFILTLLILGLQARATANDKGTLEMAVVSSSQSMGASRTVSYTLNGETIHNLAAPDGYVFVTDGSVISGLREKPFLTWFDYLVIANLCYAAFKFVIVLYRTRSLRIALKAVPAAFLDLAQFYGTLVYGVKEAVKSSLYYNLTHTMEQGFKTDSVPLTKAGINKE